MTVTENQHDHNPGLIRLSDVRPQPAAPLPGVPEPFFKAITITPDLARTWLDHNAGNRNIRERVVAAYARDMLAGNWPLHTQGVGFDTNDVLIDGQHRLWAIIRAGVPVRMLVGFELAPEARRFIDNQKPRSLPDELTIETGAPNSNVVVGIARMQLSLRGRHNPTNSELRQHLAQHPEIDEAARVGTRVSRALKGGGSLYGTAFLAMAQKHRVDALQFMELLETGANLSAGHPVLTLRNLILCGRMPRRSNAALNVAHRLAYIYRAWNAWRRNSELKIIRYSPGQTYPEPV